MTELDRRAVAAGFLLCSLVACGSPTARTAAPAAPPGPKPQGQVVPIRYDEDRFYARPVAARTGETLNIFLDTGGNNFLYADVAKRLGLEPVTLGEGEEERTEVPFPELTPGGSMPLPQTREGRVLLFDRDADDDDWSGMLGPEWFGQRCWLFDYPARRMVLLRDCDPRGQTSAHDASLGFGEGLWFPRIQVAIDGQTLDLLFDTGATTSLAPPAMAAIADGRAATRATSFIARSVFEKWHQAHPDWRVIENAESVTGEAMIEVPAITVAGHTIGPVWFTRRADKNFHEFMSQWMDRRIDGALGGNALRFFEVVVDYPHARASFERRSE